MLSHNKILCGGLTKEYREKYWYFRNKQASQVTRPPLVVEQNLREIAKVRLVGELNYSFLEQVFSAERDKIQKV